MHLSYSIKDPSDVNNHKFNDSSAWLYILFQADSDIVVKPWTKYGCSFNIREWWFQVRERSLHWLWMTMSLSKFDKKGSSETQGVRNGVENDRVTEL